LDTNISADCVASILKVEVYSEQKVDIRYGQDMRRGRVWQPLIQTLNDHRKALSRHR
jgi:hypothetical protein